MDTHHYYVRDPPPPQKFSRFRALEHKVLVPRNEYLPAMNCFSCGRLALINKAVEDRDVGVYGNCVKCGGTIGRIYGLYNEFPRDMIDHVILSTPEKYRISPCFIAIFSDDAPKAYEDHPGASSYKKTLDFMDRFEDRLTAPVGTGQGTSPRAVSSWAFLGECPFIEDETSYHTWRRIATGDWEDFTLDQITMVLESAKLASQLRDILEEDDWGWPTTG